MTKKVLSVILCLIMAVGACIGFTSCSNQSDKKAEITRQEVIDELVSCALDEADVRIEDYIDVSHFVNLAAPTQSSIKSTAKKLAVSEDEVFVSDEQYTALTSSIDEIFSELTEEEYEAVKTLAEDDGEIAEMLQMVENNFEGYGIEAPNSEVSISAAKVALTSSALVTIGSILLSQGVAHAAIVAIKGAFNTMIATLKAFFLPTAVKAVIVTAALLILVTVVIINWNKIEPVFNRIANVFINNAKKLASTVTNVFNRIFNTAKASSISAGKDAAFSNDIINQMVKFGLTQAIITTLIKKFTNININEDNTDDKTIYLGDSKDKYEEIAKKENGISFHVDNDTWTDLFQKYGKEGLWLVNKAFLQYVVHKRWEIVLVSNPYNYYNLVYHTKIIDSMYARELDFLANKGATWRSEIYYWRVIKAW